MYLVSKISNRKTLNTENLPRDRKSLRRLVRVRVASVVFVCDGGVHAWLAIERGWKWGCASSSFARSVG